MSLPSWPSEDFDAVLEAHGRSNSLCMPLLVYLDLFPKPLKLWGGEYPLTSGGIVWTGTRLLGSVDGLGGAFDFTAAETALTLSGVDPSTIALIEDGERSDYIGRLAGFYMQLCDLNYQSLCAPFAISAGFMASIVVDRTQQVETDGTVRWLRTMKMSVWNLASGRGNAPASFNTDRDQQMRFPGDLFFSFVSTTQDKSINVPWINGN